MKEKETDRNDCGTPSNLTLKQAEVENNMFFF